MSTTQVRNKTREALVWCEWRLADDKRYLAVDVRYCRSLDDLLGVLDEVRGMVELAEGDVLILLHVPQHELPPSGLLAAVKRAHRTWLHDHNAKVAVVVVGAVARAAFRGVQLATGGRGPLAFADEVTAVKYLLRAADDVRD